MKLTFDFFLAAQMLVFDRAIEVTPIVLSWELSCADFCTWTDFESELGKKYHHFSVDVVYLFFGHLQGFGMQSLHEG